MFSHRSSRAEMASRDFHLVWLMPPGIKPVLGGPVNEIRNDAVLRPGAGGAPIIELATGKVIGVHIAGEYKVANTGLSLARFTRDLPLLKKQTRSTTC